MLVIKKRITVFRKECGFIGYKFVKNIKVEFRNY